MRTKITTVLSFLLLLFGFSAFAQEIQVSGNVTSSDDGLTMPGVSIVVVGTTTGTSTDFDGNYSIIANQGDQLQFSFIGYATKSITVSGTSMNIVLDVDAAALDEVIVVGYGVKKKDMLSGSVSTVKAALIENVAVPSFEQALQGSVTGLQSVNSSGSPGAASQVIIRGIGSINGETQPLYIVDGVPINVDPVSQSTDGTLTNPLANINSSDIANVTVLKDAAATSIYGSRAANGVIIVTTKTGTTGETKFRLNAQYGVSSKTTSNFEVLNSSEFVELMKEAEINAGVDPAQAAINVGTDEIKTDWMGEAFNNFAPTAKIDFSASGGSEKTKYFTSIGLYDVTGIALGSDLKRFSYRLNLDQDVNDNIKFGAKLTVSTTDQNTPPTESAYFISPVVGAYLMRPNVPARNPDGSPYFAESGPTGGASFIGVDAYNENNMKTLRFIGSMYASFDFWKDRLNFRTTLGADMTDVDETNWDDPRNPGNTAETLGGRKTRSNTKNQVWNISNVLSFNDTYNEIHYVSAMLGQEAQSTEFNSFYASGVEFPSVNLRTLENSAKPETTTGTFRDWSLVSYFGSGTYSYDSRYTIDASLRQDGSSRFGADNRWAMFWAVGATWKITNESFMQDNNLFNNLQLRASYGTSGNQPAAYAEGGYPNYYPSLGLYTYGRNYQDKPGSAPGQIANPDLKWESSKNFNVGFDVGMMDNRIRAVVDFYQRDTEDLLLLVPISSTSGFTTAWKNIGAIRNKGVEIELNYDILSRTSSDDLYWRIGANVTFNKNEILELNNDEDIIDGTKIRRVGENYQSFYMTEWAGVNTATGQAMWHDTEGNLTMNYADADRAIQGNADPKFYGGASTELSYKGFSLSAFFSYNYGNLIYNSTSRITNSDGAFHMFNQGRDQLDRWQKPGDVAHNPKRVKGNSSQSNQMSTRWLEDGSFLRLKNVTLSYDLPREWTNKVKLGSARLYLQGQNLYTWTEYSGLDPEQALNGTSWFVYPNAKTFTFGLDVSF